MSAARPLSPRMLNALLEATEQVDGSVVADDRTTNALIRRGLVRIRRGRGTGRRYQGPFRRSQEYMTYDVITGVYINDAGREVLSQYVEAGVTGEASSLGKTAAAAIIAENISAWCTRQDVDDSEITATLVRDGMERCAVSEFVDERRAALARPALRTVRIEYRRSCGLI